MTTSKNEEEILRELCRDPYECHNAYNKAVAESSRERLRSALASYTMHLKGEIPVKMERQVVGHKWNTEQPETYYGQSEEAVEYFNSAIDQVHTLLDEKIRKLTE